MQQHANSEVARLMRQIAEEQEAAHLALHGVAVVAPHEAITARMERIGKCQERLTELVGAQEATKLTIQALDGDKQHRGMRLDDPGLPALLLQPLGYTLELEPTPEELYSLYWSQGKFTLAALHGKYPAQRLLEEADWASCLEKMPESIKESDGWFKQ